MAKVLTEPSRTFNEYLLIPGYSGADCVPDRVSLRTPLVRFSAGNAPRITLSLPVVSAIMQSVSGDRMAVALAQEGGLSFIFGAQSVENEAEMVRRAKSAVIDRQAHPLALCDTEGHPLVGAGINSRDYEERVPALLAAGADVLCIDSSEGFSEWQKRTLAWIRERCEDSVPVGAGNIVDADGFRFLADCGADFVKIGIGGGSICITRETKGIGRGQASAVMDVAAARDAYFAETGVYVPVCSDGGIVYDHHITLALAMGADFCMLGRYFARMEESPSRKVTVDGKEYKEYWGEGSTRARNWQRYDLGGEKKLSFAEGVDSRVPYAGTVAENLAVTMYKVRSTMCNCGALSLAELREKAVLTVVSPVSIAEGGAHDVLEVAR